MAKSWREKYRDTFESGKYCTTKEKIVHLAQYIRAERPDEPKVYAVYEALEQFEDMTGYFCDPTYDELEDILMEVY